MFWNKKKLIEEPNPIIIHFKELWNEVANSYKSINKAMQTVIAREGIIRLYSEGTDKDLAIKRLKEARNDFRNTLAAYEEARSKMLQYYAVKKYDIDFELPTWNPYQWKESADVVEDWYKREQMTFIKRG